MLYVIETTYKSDLIKMDMRISNIKEYNDLIRPIVIVTKIISIWPLDRGCSKKTIILRNCHTAAMFFMVIKETN